MLSVLCLLICLLSGTAQQIPMMSQISCANHRCKKTVDAAVAAVGTCCFMSSMLEKDSIVSQFKSNEYCVLILLKMYS